MKGNIGANHPAWKHKKYKHIINTLSQHSYITFTYSYICFICHRFINIWCIIWMKTVTLYITECLLYLLIMWLIIMIMATLKTYGFNSSGKTSSCWVYADKGCWSLGGRWYDSASCPCPCLVVSSHFVVVF